MILGAAGPLGRRVAALTAADPDVGRVVAVDPAVDAAELPSSVEVLTPDPGASGELLAQPALRVLLGEADAVIDLGASVATAPEGLPTSGSPLEDLARTRALLAAAAAAGPRHLVVLSTAMVYGAWANNPVPLTEEAPLRPDPTLLHATARAEAERAVHEWRSEHPGTTVAVLRPTVSVALESVEWLAASPWSAAGLRVQGTDRPSQFLHLDDLASAVDHARRAGLAGPFNVAPDGWLPADQLRDLAGPVGRLHLPAGFAGRLSGLATRVAPAGPPEGAAYVRQPWVVANDRLRATGWAPRHRNEEAYIEADPGGPLASMSPRRRQELSLLAAGAVLAAGTGAVLWALRRRRARRR